MNVEKLLNIDNKDLNKVKDVNIKNHKINDKNLNILSIILKIKNVQNFILKDCDISSNNMITILSEVLHKSTVKSLVLHNCNLNSEIICSILNKEYDTIISKNKNIKKIKNNKLKKDVNHNVNNNLELLDLSFNNFDSKSYKYISSMISKCHKLKILALDGNKMDNEDVQFIMQSVRTHPSIHHISLSHCGIKDEGMECICYGLSSNRYVDMIHRCMCMYRCAYRY